MGAPFGVAFVAGGAGVGGGVALPSDGGGGGGVDAGDVPGCGGMCSRATKQSWISECS